MADTNTSFIPKRTPTKPKKRGSATQRLYILAYTSYIILFGTLIASAGVYVYQLQLTSTLVEQQERLVAERNAFSEVEMQRMLSLEKRLDATADRVGQNVSFVTLFEAVEQFVVETVQFSSLRLARVDDDTVAVNATAKTDSIDSTIFQRRVVTNAELIEDELFTELTFGAANASDSVAQASGISEIGFTLTFLVPTEAIPYVPARTNTNTDNDTTTGGSAAATSSQSSSAAAENTDSGTADAANQSVTNEMSV